MGVPSSEFDTLPSVKHGEIIRCVGQAIFSAMTQFYGMVDIHTCIGHWPKSARPIDLRGFNNYT